MPSLPTGTVTFLFTGVEGSTTLWERHPEEMRRGLERHGQCLARGWPIGTGVIESACGHLVKDRLQQSGMRWTKDGAHAVLDLRAIRLTDNWDPYWAFHRQHQHRRLYGSSATTPAPPDAQFLASAAAA